jgi:HTH-type transcriptional regulator/antitoxin HigA
VLDAGGADEDNPLAILAERMGDLVAGYETHHGAEPVGSGVDALRFLMSSHGMAQGDMPEVASQGVMSEILNGKRALNVRQVQALAARFGVPAQVFLL